MKRNNKREIERIRSVLESDRINVGDSFKELLELDLKKLLSDYFELESMPKTEFYRQNDKIVINIGIKALRIKGFGQIPSEEM